MMCSGSINECPRSPKSYDGGVYLSDGDGKGGMAHFHFTDLPKVKHGLRPLRKQPHYRLSRQMTNPSSRQSRMRVADAEHRAHRR
jgi:hypothetical protein